jgi:hypothetical protein
MLIPQCINQLINRSGRVHLCEGVAVFVVHGECLAIEDDLDVRIWDRKSERIGFGRGIDAYMMGIDGTWRRDCKMNDVSQTGARLTVNGSIQGLDLKEFFLPFVLHRTCLSPLPNGSTRWGSNRRRVF